MKKCIVSIWILFLMGCASSHHYDYYFDEDRSVIATKEYRAKISMVSIGYQPKNAYKLEITNYSDKDIEIDWNKTQFIINGQTQGGFMFEGVRYVAREDAKNPSFVLGKGNFSKLIYPNYMVGSVMRGHWDNYTIPDGETGVFLALKIGNKEVKEKLYITKTTRLVPNIK